MFCLIKDIKMGGRQTFWQHAHESRKAGWLLDISGSLSKYQNYLQLIVYIPLTTDVNLLILSSGQAVWVWTVSLPVTIVNASDRTPSLQAVDIIGWIMWLVGLIVEAMADQQKLVFKGSAENRGKWCDIGLWKYSRHPNYFGEVKKKKNLLFFLCYSRN